MRRLSEEAVMEARSSGVESALVTALVQRYIALEGTNRVEEQLAVAEEVSVLTERSQERVLALDGRRAVVDAAYRRGDARTVDHQLGITNDWADRVRLPEYQWAHAVFVAGRALLQTDTDTAAAFVESAYEAGRALNWPLVGTIYGIQLVTVRRSQDRAGEILPLVQAAAEAYPGLIAWQCGVAALLAEAGDLAAAKARVDALVEDQLAGVPRDFNWLSAATLLADAAAEIDDQVSAAVIYERLRPWTGLAATTAHGAQCSGSIDRQLGRLATVIGDLKGAERHITAALDLNRRLRSPKWEAATKLAQAELLIRRGRIADRDALSAVVAEVQSTARQFRLHLVARQAWELSKRCGLS
jgi:hypothetical protein